MAQSGDQLIEGGVYTRPAYLFHLRFGVQGDRDALVDFFFGLGNELILCYRSIGKRYG